MPGPQGPEANKTTEGNIVSKITKEGSSATEIGKEDAPKSSPIADTNKETPVQNANASPAATASSASKGATTSTQTKTTSTQGQRVAGYRYYRDLGKQ